VITGMVALLVLGGTTVVSAEQIPTESVKRTIHGNQDGSETLLLAIPQYVEL
jgi:hypothetical protein